MRHALPPYPIPESLPAQSLPISKKLISNPVRANLPKKFPPRIKKMPKKGKQEWFVLIYPRSNTNLSTGILDSKDTSLNRVDKNESTLEVWVHTPSAIEFILRGSIILGINIKETNFPKLGPVGGSSNSADVNDSEARAVVRHVGLSVEDVEVVVDSLGSRGVGSSVDWPGEAADVPNVGGSLCVAFWRGVFLLIELVVEKKVSHGVVCEPALVGVGCARVGGAGDNLDGGFDGDIVDGQGVFVVGEADFFALVGGIRTGVNLCVYVSIISELDRCILCTYNTLSVVDVAV